MPCELLKLWEKDEEKPTNFKLSPHPLIYPCIVGVYETITLLIKPSEL